MRTPSLPPDRQRPEQVSNHCARWTGPRDEVFNVLVKSEQHLSVKDIFAALRTSCPDIGLTTVYRTLELLDRAGLIRRIGTRTGEVRFEYRRADQADHHHHLICTVCGSISNYRDFEKEELDLVRRTEEALTRKHGFLIRDHNIEFLGLCPECQPGGPRSLIHGPRLAVPPRRRRNRRAASAQRPARETK